MDLRKINPNDAIAVATALASLERQVDLAFNVAHESEANKAEWKELERKFYELSLICPHIGPDGKSTVETGVIPNKPKIKGLTPGPVKFCSVCFNLV